MGLAICSLKWDAARPGAKSQTVSYDSDGYYLVRFPYETEEESYDPWEMHAPTQGDSTSPSEFPDARSGLIWPSHDGWGVLSAMVFWAHDGSPSEYRARFVRDPLAQSTGYDSTGTCDSAPTGGQQYRTYVWQIFVTKGTPLGLKITARGARDARIATRITLAEFKLAIQTDIHLPPTVPPPPTA